MESPGLVTRMRGRRQKKSFGPLWFDDSKNFCLFRQDLRGLGEVSYINCLKGRPLAQNSPIILVGDSVVLYNEITLYDVSTKTQKKVKIDKWQDQQMRILHSDTKANKLYLERRNRRNTMLDVCEVDLSTGDVKVIIMKKGIRISALNKLRSRS